MYDEASIIQEVDRYYTDKIHSHGPGPEGVDWNSKASQWVRFQQLMRVIWDERGLFSINDLGCGYGALIDYLLQHYPQWTYRGYDVSEAMISCAGSLWTKVAKAHSIEFVHGRTLLLADFTVASGIFNVKLETDNESWLSYVIRTLCNMNIHSVKGFAFNMLTCYSDPPFMRDYLYYADPCSIFDYCKRNFSRNVALLHDYDLYEFTIIVRKLT